MSKDTRVLNVTRGFHLRFNQACRAVENCACEWVEVGVSVRSLTLQESIAARAKQAANREPLPFSELPNLRYEPQARGERAYWESRVLSYEAAIFAQDVVRAQ